MESEVSIPQTSLLVSFLSDLPDLVQNLQKKKTKTFFASKIMTTPTTDMASLHIGDGEFLDLHEQQLLDRTPDASFALFVNHKSASAQCAIYRRPMANEKNPNLYEYLTTGTWTGLHPEKLFLATLDHEYRKSWDETVLSVEVVDTHRPSDEHSPTELIHWLSKFPFPMSNREFVYVRRGVQVGDHYYVLSRHCEHHAKPVKSSPVRVTPMTMAFVMRADGADTKFAIQYADDLGGSIPSMLLNAAASKLIPAGIDQTYAKSRVFPDDRKAKLVALHPTKLTPRAASTAGAATTDDSSETTTTTAAAAPAL